jgi:hypothetical protein
MDISNITRVYSGKIGCMCGCNGKYTTNPAYKEQVSKERGYPVSDDECNTRSVKIIAGKVLRNSNAQAEGNYMFVEQNGRISVVYFAK